MDAKLSFDLDGSTLTQPLGSAELELAVATVRMPERTSSHELILSGMALPNSSITIYDSRKPLKTVTSNSAGFWSAAAPLNNPYSYVYHNISVGVTHENLPREFLTEPKLVIYDSSHVEPLKVTMYTGTGTVVFDFRNPTTDPYYVYTKNHISFVVELNRNDDPLIDQVYVVTANDNKQTTYIRCAYDDTKNAWVGSHNYSGSTDAPIGLDVQIIMKDAVPPELEEEFVEDLEQEYQQILDAFDKKMEQTRAELEKEIILPNLKEMTISPPDSTRWWVHCSVQPPLAHKNSRTTI